MTQPSEGNRCPTTWIVAAALSRDPAYDALIDAIANERDTLVTVRKDPHSALMIAIDRNGREIIGGLDSLRGPVLTIGTVSMKVGSDDRGWTPGYVDCPGQAETAARWGDLMLNHDARATTLGELRIEGHARFVRPESGGKTFTGLVVTPCGLNKWRAGLLEGAGAPPVPESTRVMESSLKTIWAEYRLIAVEGAIITGSRYRTAGRTAHSPDVGDRFIRFGQQLLDIWNPGAAVAIDVADTPDGIRVVETNPISSAGFYCIDMPAFVHAMSKMAGRTVR